MKKSLIALAIMAAAGAASAQSSVTLFGIVDVTIANYSVSGGAHNTILTNSGYNSARLGFRGTEDLGGGLAASFWLEGSLAPDNGNASGQTWQRRSTVSLSGGWGELRLGRDYVPTFWNLTVFDPFGTNGVGTVVGFKAKTTTAAGTPLGLVAGTAVAANDVHAVRSDNMVQYFLPPNLGGFYGQASYAFDESNTNNAGRYYGLRVGYGAGPFNVAAAFGKTTGLTTGAAPDIRTWNIGGQWDFGMAKLLAQYDNNRYDATTVNATLKSWLIGGLIPVGAGEIRLSYSDAKLSDTGANSPRADQWALGYVHNLSKRTALYATYARVNNKDGSALPISASLPQSNAVTGITNASSSGFDLGIRHSF
jgi:predicted porin